MTYIRPEFRLSAFNCPHCGVLTSQTWYSAYACNVSSSELEIIDDKDIEDLGQRRVNSSEEKEKLLEVYRGLRSGKILLIKQPAHDTRAMLNLNASSCFVCKDVTLWVRGSIVHPRTTKRHLPNVDTPDEIKRDFAEAAEIVSVSPRGAAALLRLCIQKLCIHLGLPGKEIDKDIATLVSRGLDPRIQEALDTVRVIGNEAVHPGTMDISDDQEIASSLFQLFNFIVDKLISEPKHIGEMYTRLPENKLRGIQDRDKKNKL